MSISWLLGLLGSSELQGFNGAPAFTLWGTEQRQGHQVACKAGCRAAILSAHPRPGAQEAGVHPHLPVPNSRGTCSNLSPTFSSLDLFPCPQNQGGRQDSWPSEGGLQTRPLCCWFTTSQVQKLRAVQKLLVLMTLLHSQAHDQGDCLAEQSTDFCMSFLQMHKKNYHKLSSIAQQKFILSQF